jgi:GT2 family glycosyltransferase
VTPVIILARNNVADTIKCIDSIRESFGVSFRLLVLDNASTDGTNKLRSHYPMMENLYVVSFNNVQSVAHCWNMELSFMLASWDHVVVLNNDIIVQPDTICTLIENRSLGGIVTAVSVDSMDNLRVGQPIGLPRPHPNFSAFLINRDCYQAVGPFDERFEGAYFEDNDYHIRVVQAGFKAVCLNLPVYHRASGTLKNATPQEKSRIEKHFVTNKAFFQQKWGCLPGDSRYKQLTNNEVMHE